MLARRDVGAEANDTEGSSVKVVGADDDFGSPVRDTLYLVAPFAHGLNCALNRLGTAVHRQNLMGPGKFGDLLVEYSKWSLWKAREVNVSLRA
jgi:hypothetical protein